MMTLVEVQRYRCLLFGKVAPSAEEHRRHEAYHATEPYVAPPSPRPPHTEHVAKHDKEAVELQMLLACCKSLAQKNGGFNEVVYRHGQVLPRIRLVPERDAPGEGSEGGSPLPANISTSSPSTPAERAVYSDSSRCLGASTPSKSGVKGRPPLQAVGDFVTNTALSAPGSSSSVTCWVRDTADGGGLATSSPSPPPQTRRDDAPTPPPPEQPLLPCIKFESRFECGNLAMAVRQDDAEYDLLMMCDLNTNGYTQWFNFTMKGMLPGIPYKFNLLNAEKPDRYRRPFLFLSPLCCCCCC
jgi:hypothetical protein